MLHVTQVIQTCAKEREQVDGGGKREHVRVFGCHPSLARGKKYMESGSISNG